ncbi:putative endonuclease [Gilliamella bombicola]|uniref:Putative endonuclease n=1 Tax=Gilliamella bombicola TaxID=1798182 RepID=A0A1C3ZC22_9GAMM|nr:MULTISPECIES: GIY-YIG nuclease family protein [Gilliamella]MWN06598.1 GIY-YIG nuclease family protein [Gilliamella sp. Pas-s95]NUF27693.1 GIY-YIG nuclease family protein [Gilliamella sp. ESL0254]SCB79929.1 putative endonuclease [Gilliamella bombicola]
MSNKVSNWFLYIVRTANQLLYTGITTDVARRLQQHQSGKGAKCLKGHQDLTVVYQIFIGDKSIALKLEYKIKQLSKQKKEALVKNRPNFDELLKLIN